MSAPHWRTSSVPAPAEDEKAGYYNQLEQLIEAEATSFTEPARFRAALARVLTTAENLDVDPLAAALCWDAVARVIIAVQKFSRPAVTFDAIHCALHKNGGRAFMADYARKHRMSRQSFHERVIRVSAVIGLTYQRIKPRRGKC